MEEEPTGTYFEHDWAGVVYLKVNVSRRVSKTVCIKPMTFEHYPHYRRWFKHNFLLPPVKQNIAVLSP